MDVDAQNKVCILILIKIPNQYFEMCIQFFTTLHGRESRPICTSMKYMKGKTKDAVSCWTL